jgi:hypothetical protein
MTRNFSEVLLRARKALEFSPELKEKFPKAPFIPRPGQIDPWDNEDFG